MRQRNVPRCSSDRGFTLVELMVAAAVLLVGLLGTFTMLDGANRTVQENNGRIAASNLAREIAEQARGVDYNSIAPATLESLIRPKIDPGPGGTAATSGAAWTVDRRGVLYGIRLNVCTFDDPKDGVVTDATLKAPNACETPAAVNANVDPNPDDFRRVEMVLSWTRAGQQRTLTQTSLIVNPSGGLGPRVDSLKAVPELAQVTDPLQANVNFAATTKPAAATLRWYADDGYTQDLSGSGTSWAFSWPIGQVGVEPFLRDGPYTVSAQAFSSRGVPGEVAVTTVLLNRRAPTAVPNVIAGRNNRHGGIVDVRWSRLRDRDIQEYRVYRVLETTSGTTRTRVCPTSAANVLATECTDTSPPGTSSGNLSYEVMGVDRVDLSLSSAFGSDTNLREGARVSRLIGNTGTRPPAPSLVEPIVTTADGRPSLSWTQPSGEEILFYRIYRVPTESTTTGLAARYDRTLTTATNYSDPSPGASSSYRYWVTAVDTTMDESADSNMVTWVRP